MFRYVITVYARKWEDNFEIPAFLNNVFIFHIKQETIPEKFVTEAYFGVTVLNENLDYLLE